MFDKCQPPWLEPPKYIAGTNFGKIWGWGRFCLMEMAVPDLLEAERWNFSPASQDQILTATPGLGQKFTNTKENLVGAKNCPRLSLPYSGKPGFFTKDSLLPPRIRCKIVRRWGWGSNRNPEQIQPAQKHLPPVSSDTTLSHVTLIFTMKKRDLDLGSGWKLL